MIRDELARNKEQCDKIKKSTALALLHEEGQIFMRWYDGDIWINGELVATYEGIIQ